MSSAGAEEDGFTPVLSAAEKKKQRKQAREQEQKRQRDQGRQKGSNAQTQSQAQPPRGAAQTPLNMQPIKAQITVPPSAGPSPPAARPSSQSSPAPPSPAPPVRPPKPDHGAPVPAGLRSPTSGPLSPTNDFFSNSGNLRHYALGRAPWYNESGQKKPFIIGITGGTASGKTTICHKVVEALGMPWVIELSMDRFYRPLTKDQMANVKDYNFDHPEAFDWDLLLHTLRLLRDGKKVEVPIYSFKSHSREKETDTLYGADVIIFEGIFALFDPRVRTFLDLKVFVDTDSDTRLARRLTRDIVERGRTVEGVLAQYTKTVKPSYDEYIAPTKRFADLIIPWTGGEASLGPPTLMVQQREEVPVHQLKSVAVDLMVEHIKAQLVNRGVEFQQGILQQQYHPGVFRAGAYNMSVLPRNVAVLERTVNLRQLHTVLRDRDTEQEDFQEAVHRVSRLTLARAMDLVPDVCSPVTVRTPTDNTFTAQRFDMSKLCGVAIVRGGKPLQGCLKHMAPDASMGDIVIQQSGNKTEGPRLYYSKLPDQISSGRVILMDALVSTANNVVMAVHVLLDHGVKEENIVLVTLVSTPQGLMALSKRFPAMQIVTSWVDEGLDGHLFVSPGLGAFGDRYYGDHSALSLSLSSVPELATPSRR